MIAIKLPAAPQVLCAEGKSRKALPVTAKVPQVKRTLERFVLQIKAFFHDMQHSGANPGVKVRREEWHLSY